MPAELTASSRKQQQVLDRLESPIKTRDDLLRLFVNTLGYQRVERPIPISKDTFGEGIALDLAQQYRPLRLAEAGAFHVIYTELDGDRLDYRRQRVLASKLLETFPDALFVFARAGTLGDSRGAEAHLVNVKTADRRVFRRFKLGPDERYRTAAERMALLDVSEVTDLSMLAIRARHEAAFDVEPVTRQFFRDFCSVFDLVCKDIARRQSRWNSEHVEREAQTLLDRLLFLYFIQRKGWLNRDRNFLYRHFRQHLAESKDSATYLEKFLKPLFTKLSTEGSMADIAGFDLPFLNGGLFADEYGAEQRDKSARRRHSLKVCNSVFAHVFDELLEAYNFTVREDTPLNQDVAIDPEMLGKIFESLVLQIEQTDTSGKTSRHDTGSHYTPRPIVHYLCRDGLRIWLEQAPPDPARAQDWPDRLQKLLALDASDGVDPETMAVLESCLTPDEARVLLERLDNLRACDPAVGSGAFPVGLLYELVNLARLCETRLRGKDPVADDPEWLFITKSRFIQRVIYGVDIQERAVEICKLRLWLSLIVDHPLDVDVDKCSAKDFRHALKKLPALPNLDFKIRVANSLIDRVHGEPVNLTSVAAEDKTLPPILNKLTGAKRQFYEAHSITDKRRLRFDILDATAELAMVELARSKLSFGLLVDESDEAAMTRLAELDRALKEMGAVREQIAAARRPKTKASVQDETLERLTERFNDPKKPTFVWQLDFAEVFHRFIGARNGDLAPEESKAAADSSAKSGTGRTGGFDLVVGNPPYIRIQVLKGIAPEDAAYFEDHYASAGKGNYDIYVVFVERSLQLMNPKGVLAFILPHKFFNAQYGEPLRAQLAKGRHLSHVVHFGDQQIFPGATNYVCLLFLSRAGADACRWVRADNLPDWLITRRAPETSLPAARFTPAEWNFAVGTNAGLQDKLQALPIKVARIATRIAQGIRTSANEVYVLDVRSEKGGLITAYSKQLDQDVVVERKAVLRFLQGREIKAYSIQSSNKVVLMPYRIQGGDATLASERELAQAMPRAFDYYRANKHYLSQREGGRFKGPEWFQFGRKQNIDLMLLPKILVPDIADRAAFALDEKGDFAFTSGYGITFREGVRESTKYFLALLNSAVLDWYWRRISTPLRGGFFRYFTQFIEQLPIVPVDFSNASERAEHDALVSLVERILSAKRAAPDADTTALEREIDERVYRLYGLTADEIKLVEESTQSKP